MRLTGLSRFLSLLAFFAVLSFFGADAGAPDAASAVTIPASSCIQDPDLDPANYPCQGASFTYIGADSCNGANACNGATGSIGADSCNGDEACQLAGTDGGSSTIGRNSCNGEQACQGAGYQNGSSTIGNDSCRGYAACQGAGFQNGSSTIGNDSCRGYGACVGAGWQNGSSTIGDDSCAGFGGCQGAGMEGVSSVGDGSCRGDEACANHGFQGEASIGNGSCLGSSACRQAGTQGESHVADGSCHGTMACMLIGGSSGASDSSAVIGPGSCMGTDACFGAGVEGEGAVVGAGSCSGEQACFVIGYLGDSASFGASSCNGAKACYAVGAFAAGEGSIGDNSCNGPEQCSQETVFDPNTGTGTVLIVGDCEENSVIVPACSRNVEVFVTYGDAAVVFPVEGCTSAYTPATPVSASPLEFRCEGFPVGTITIRPAALVVSPDAQTWALGGPEPEYTYRIEGWKNGDTAATAKGYVAPTCGTRSTPTVAGTSTIVCAGGSAANYRFVYEGALLTATGSLPPTPVPPTPTPPPAPLPGWQSYLANLSSQLGYTYGGDCATATTAGSTCSSTSTRSAQGGAGEQLLTVRLHLVLDGGAMSTQFITLEFRGSGLEWLLVSQSGSLTAAPAEPTTTPVRPAPAPPNTGTGSTGSTGSSAAWLLVLGAMAMAAGGAAVWGESRR